MNIQSLTNAIEIWFLSQDNVQNMEKKASKGSIYRDELFLGLCLHPLSLLWFSNFIFLLLLTSWLWLGQNVVDDAWERMVSASGFSFFFFLFLKHFLWMLSVSDFMYFYYQCREVEQMWARMDFICHSATIILLVLYYLLKTYLEVMVWFCLRAKLWLIARFWSFFFCCNGGVLTSSITYVIYLTHWEFNVSSVEDACCLQ